MPAFDDRVLSTADPARFKVGDAAASRLGKLAGLPAEKLAGRPLSDIEADFRFQVDPELFLFRRICGRVVKTDPVTGVDYPVPFATVEVEDTDCSFIGYFPRLSPWVWYFPFRCHREVIATAQTDECGEFCVWVPRFDIDWVLRFRHERICFPIIFQRPTLKDVLDRLPPIVPPIDGGGPIPPRPDPRVIDRLREGFGRTLAMRVDRLQGQPVVGAPTREIDAALAAPAALDKLRPPLSPELHGLETEGRTRDAPGVAADTIAARLGLDPSDIKGLDLSVFIGPFRRCYDVVFPEWTPILDVPDITFRVLQDTNGDGVQEQIYGESYFQVRWDSIPSSPVVLHVGPNALASALCGTVEIPCTTEPAIVMADRLPVSGSPDIFDPATGYAVRVNRPHPSGDFDEVLPMGSTARAPLAGTFALFGCNKTDPTATHYRLVYRYRATGSATFTDPTPFAAGHNVYFRATGGPLLVYPDPLGWFPINLPPTPPGEVWFPQNLLMDWATAAMPDGTYAVTLELGTGGTTASSHSAEVMFVIDNGAPAVTLTVEVGPSATGPFTPIDAVCPVVRRGVVPADRYFRVTVEASDPHLRSAALATIDCGGGSFVLQSGSGGFDDGASGFRYWHETVGTVSRTLQAVYLLPAATALEGTYGFSATVAGRAFSPTGFDSGHLTVPPWQYDPMYQYVSPSAYFSVVNSNP
jgi:hypothetical protein